MPGRPDRRRSKSDKSRVSVGRDHCHGWVERDKVKHHGWQRKIRVAVIFGGRSSEHEISCVTGSVMSAIDTDRYDILPIGITDGD